MNSNLSECGVVMLRLAAADSVLFSITAEFNSPEFKPDAMLRVAAPFSIDDASQCPNAARDLTTPSISTEN